MAAPNRTVLYAALIGLCFLIGLVYVYVNDRRGDVQIFKKQITLANGTKVFVIDEKAPLTSNGGWPGQAEQCRTEDCQSRVRARIHCVDIGHCGVRAGRQDVLHRRDHGHASSTHGDLHRRHGCSRSNDDPVGVTRKHRHEIRSENLYVLSVQYSLRVFWYQDVEGRVRDVAR